jgi:nucleolar GTP-binding protein
LEEDHERKNALESEESDLDETDTAILQAIRDKKTMVREASHIAKTAKSQIPRSALQGKGISMSKIVDHLDSVGVESEGIVTSRGRKRTRDRYSDKDRDDDSVSGAAMEDGEGEESSKRSRSKSRELSRTRSQSRGQSVPGQAGLSTDADRDETNKQLKKYQRGAKGFGKHRKAGEADRKTGPKLDKHMMTGKMGLGTRRSR